MGYVSCTACARNVLPRAPSRSFGWLMVSFWVFSLLFGIGAAVAPGWGFPMLVAWLLLACIVGMNSQRATTWTCPSCGAAIVTPVSEAPPQAATSSVV